MPSKSGHGRVFGAVISDGLSDPAKGSRASLPRPRPRPRFRRSPPRSTPVAAGGVSLHTFVSTDDPPPAPASSGCDFPRRAGVVQAEAEVDDTGHAEHEFLETLASSQSCECEEIAPPPPPLWPAPSRGPCGRPSLSRSRPSSHAAAEAAGGCNVGDAAAISRRRGKAGADFAAGIGCGGVASTEVEVEVVEVVGAVSVEARQRRVADATAAMRPLKSIKVSWPERKRGGEEIERNLEEIGPSLSRFILWESR